MTPAADAQRKDRRNHLLFRSFLAVVFISILMLARANYGTFPFANEDEATFFIPAWNLAVFGNLQPLALNAPNGIYWVPHGFYLWLALFLRLFGATRGVAVAVCQATTATATVLLLSALARVAQSRWFASVCAVVLVSPATIFAANTIRMESLVLLLYAAAAWLHSRHRNAAAIGVLALSLLVHPALGLSLSGYLLSLLALAGLRRSGSALSPKPAVVLSSLILLLLVLLAFAAEARLVIPHWHLFHEQMAYQAQRKAARSLADILLHRRGLLLLGETAALAALSFAAIRARAGARFLRDIAPLALLALGLQAFAAVGYELPYAVYSYAFVPATLLCAAYGTSVLIHESPCRTPREL